MVQLTTVLRHIPKIKFRKGGHGRASAPAAAASAPSPAAAAAASPQLAQQPVAAMSSAIPDLDLPYRYQRHRPTDEEIACINGGGIV